MVRGKIAGIDQATEGVEERTRASADVEAAHVGNDEPAPVGGSGRDGRGRRAVPLRLVVAVGDRDELFGREGEDLPQQAGVALGHAGDEVGAAHHQPLQPLLEPPGLAAHGLVVGWDLGPGITEMDHPGKTGQAGQRQPDEVVGPGGGGGEEMSDAPPVDRPQAGNRGGRDPAGIGVRSLQDRKQPAPHMAALPAIPVSPVIARSGAARPAQRLERPVDRDRVGNDAGAHDGSREAASITRIWRIGMPFPDGEDDGIPPVEREIARDLGACLGPHRSARGKVTRDEEDSPPCLRRCAAFSGGQRVCSPRLSGMAERGRTTRGRAEGRRTTHEVTSPSSPGREPPDR